MLDPNLTKRRLYVYKLYDRCSEKTGEIIEFLYHLVSIPYLNNVKYIRYRHALNATKEYKVWRLFCLTRDDYICQCCDDNIATQVHHIVEVKTDPRLALDPTNGISLCADCHMLQHSWL